MRRHATTGRTQAPINYRRQAQNSTTSGWGLGGPEGCGVFREFVLGVLAASYLIWVILIVQGAHAHLTYTKPKGHELAWQLGLCLCLVTLPLSLAQVAHHCTYFVQPGQQAQVIRIIGMVPVYSITCFLCLKYPKNRLCIEVVRETYEAYVIYCFVNYLINYLGGEAILVPILAVKPNKIGHHKPPFCFLRPWAMGQEFLDRCRGGAFQYLLYSICCGQAKLILDHFNIFGEGQLTPTRGFFWTTLGNCLSQSFALYSMITFYHATYKELAPAHPFLKFICIKAVVFATWWQAVGINILLHRGFLSSMDILTLEELAKVVQGLMLCSEMWIAAVGFHYAFPVSEYYPKQSLLSISFLDPLHEEQPVPRPVCEALWRSLIPHELIWDVCSLFRFIWSFLVSNCYSKLKISLSPKAAKRTYIL
mmetsp:Transcript_28132/g.36864  ORF Transcript_28132/g.36864 Transcript_28132/m.36864 type:complete len:421 (+) Transcript_28132:115-1377(+)